MEPIVTVRGLTKTYHAPRTIGQALRGIRPLVRAVENISFTLSLGETVGLLGESGCGKTTTGRLLLKLIEPTSGSIEVTGVNLKGLAGTGLRDFRRKAQFVFQNPFDALNPRIPVGQSLAEPLINAGIDGSERLDRIHNVLKRVRIPVTEGLLERYPHEMSGGQLQRIVMARALVLEPRFVVADEPVSMLDVSVRAGILNLMRDLQESMGLTAIYISHDLALARYVARRTMVMYLGEIVEDGATDDIIREPLHPYSRALIAAVPLPHVRQSRAKLPIRAGSADARSTQVGCRFANRCPFTMPLCITDRPKLLQIDAGRRVACHLVKPNGVADAS